MKKSVIKRKIIFQILAYVVLGVFSAYILLPIIYLAITSFKPQGEIYTAALPTQWVFDSYKELLQTFNFGIYFRNSLMIAGSSTLLILLIVLPAAYGFSFYGFRGSKPVLTTLVFLRMIPTITLMIPLYIYFSKLGLMDKKVGLVIADATFNLPTSLWIVSSFFGGSPRELLDAAAIDGAGRFRTFISIMLPISRPTIATVVILAFLGVWNEFMFAFISTSNEASKPITVAMSQLITRNGVRWDLMSAAGTLYIIPMLIIVVIFQKSIINGMTQGAIKG